MLPFFSAISSLVPTNECQCLLHCVKRPNNLAPPHAVPNPLTRPFQRHTRERQGTGLVTGDSDPLWTRWIVRQKHTQRSVPLESSDPSPVGRNDMSFRSPDGPPSPLLLPDLSHVQVQPLQRPQNLHVLCVERYINHDQPIRQGGGIMFDV